MMQAPLPLTKELVLIGGGHTHALVLRAWGMRPVPGVRLSVINPEPTAPYSGMLPGFVAGHYAQSQLEIDLIRLARFAGARVILGRASGIDRDARRITVPGRPAIAYDLASIDIGITTKMPRLDGFRDHAVPAKPLGPFAERWDDFVNTRPQDPEMNSVLVVGAGVAGVELALAAAHRLRQSGAPVRVTLVEAGSEPLRDLGAGARAALLARLRDEGVTLRTDTKLARISDQGGHLADGTLLPAGLVIGVAGARPHPWLADTGLALQDGFIRVTPTLMSESDPNIYAVGDCAHMVHAPRPKAGVFAVRQAPVLLHNLRADLAGGRKRAYRPQRDYLKLISTGRKHAVADKLDLRLEGAWLWRWKNNIDQKFMGKFSDLRLMPAAPPPPGAAHGVAELLADDPIPCGGCAAKLGAPVLWRGLDGAGPGAAVPEDVVTGIGDDAAVLRAGAGYQVISTDLIRAFCDDPYLVARVAATHALGDVWAMGARPQAALSVLVLPRMAPGLQQNMLREITEGARAVFATAGAALVGGHSATGAELAVGFTVTGTTPTPPIGQTGGQAGDALILTKPLGSGTLLAGEMALKADGRDIEPLYAALQMGAGPASEILAPQARAMTDVTGFGLAGHLMGLLRGAGCAADIDLAAVPLYDGALELARAGVRSSLFAQNLAAWGSQVGPTPDEARRALLFDPQTAGGLLAAVPAASADALLAALGRAGQRAARIGHLVPGAPAIRLG